MAAVLRTVGATTRRECLTWESFCIVKNSAGSLLRREEEGEEEEEEEEERQARRWRRIVAISSSCSPRMSPSPRGKLSKGSERMRGTRACVWKTQRAKYIEGKERKREEREERQRESEKREKREREREERQRDREKARRERERAKARRERRETERKREERMSDQLINVFGLGGHPTRNKRTDGYNQSSSDDN